MRRALGVLPLLVLCSCLPKAGPYIPRVDALSELDSKAYDALLVSESIITTAEASNEAGTLPAFMKPIINALIDVHNTTRVAWLSYRQVLGAGEDDLAQAEALSNMLINLDRQITSLFSSGGEP